MNECGGWRPIVPDSEGLLKKAWYFMQLVSYTVFYFFYSVGECIWKAIKKK